MLGVGNWDMGGPSTLFCFVFDRFMLVLTVKLLSDQDLEELGLRATLKEMCCEAMRSMC